MVPRWFIASFALACACGPGTRDPSESQSSGGSGDTSTTATNGTGSAGSDTTESTQPTAATSETSGASSSATGSDSTTAFSDCPDVHEGDLVVDDSTDVETLRTLRRVTGALYIEDYTGEDLAFFEDCLMRVDGSLWIRDNPSLASLAGLGRLANVSGVGIYRNPMLTSLAGLGGVTSLPDGLAIVGNASLPQVDLDQVEEIGGLVLGGCALAFQDADDNPSLENLDGLASLASLDNVQIASQSALVSLGRLHEIAMAGGFHDTYYSAINYNPSLPYEEVELLEQLSGAGTNFYSCGNLEEPAMNECYCDNPG